MKTVRTEREFANWFRKNFKKLGFSKIVRGDISRFPDFIMLRDDKEVRVELETIASNFIAHKHNINDVDEIVCLVKDVVLDKPTFVVKDIKFEGNIKVTLSINSKVYADFQKYCDEHAVMLSSRLEIEMKNIMRKKKGGTHG